MNDLDVIATAFEVGEEDATTILGLCDWVDHQVAIERHGYPRDLPAGRSLADQLDEPDYLDRLIDAAREDDDIPRSIVDILVAKRASSG